MKCILAEQGGKGGGSSMELLSIEITVPPTKTSYLAGDTFNTSGMVVTATYGMDGVPIATAEVTGYAVSPSTLTDGVTSVTVTYTELGNTCTASQAVTVTHRLSSIAVTTNPTTTSYEYGDTLATAGMVVTATYSDNTTATVTGYSCSPTALNTVGTQTITVTYAENGVSRTTTFSVTVNRKSVAKPTKIKNPSYTGSSISVASSTYWNNYNTTYFTVGGTTSATNRGTSDYTITFTLKDNYRWADGTTTALSLTWNISRVANTITRTPTSVAITADNYSDGVEVTINRLGDGSVSWSGVPTGITVSFKDGYTATTDAKVILLVKGNGSTTVSSTTITVNIAQGTNYNSGSTTFTVTATYWSFGAGTGETADATWFAGLKNYLSTHTGASLTTTGGNSIVGATKSVTLSTAVLGTTTHLIRVIGVDQDGSNTVTFQTKNCLSSYTAFGSSAVWIGSTARTLCQNYYNYFPGKDSIKTVSKGTCPTNNSSRNGSVTYNDETVFLLSEREFGLDTYSSISTANSTTTKAECTYGYNAAYSYYSSNSARIMYLGDTSTSNYGYPWERSRRYNNSDYGCRVSNDGTAGTDYYSNSDGLAPAFVIG